MELETIEAAAAVEKENRLGGEAWPVLYCRQLNFTVPVQLKLMHHFALLHHRSCSYPGPIWPIMLLSIVVIFYFKPTSLQIFGAQSRLAVLCFCDAPVRSAFERAARQVEEMAGVHKDPQRLGQFEV